MNEIELLARKHNFQITYKSRKYKRYTLKRFVDNRNIFQKVFDFFNKKYPLKKYEKLDSNLVIYYSNGTIKAFTNTGLQKTFFNCNAEMLEQLMIKGVEKFVPDNVYKPELNENGRFKRLYEKKDVRKPTPESLFQMGEEE